MERRLAAVLIADVVGYSRLSQSDEEGTRARFQADLKEVFESTIAEHHGRLVKTMGDGILVEFRSVVDALRCAVAVQQEKAKRNAIAPPDQRLDFRIGVNLGDIIVEEGDIHGNGVNIASRLEATARAGGVAISASVRDQVGDRLGLTFEDAGEQTLKNLDRPVRVFHVGWDSGSAGGTSEPVHRTFANRPSVAVLPFTNMSCDPEQAYFTDGLVEDLITDLSKMPGFFVIAGNSTFAKERKDVDVRAVARELNVHYVLQGSVRKAVNRVRITAQLVEGAGGTHIWADKFEGAFEDVFDLQDQLTESIVGALEPSLRRAEIERARGKRPDMLDAYDLYLRALPHAFDNTLADNDEAIRLLSKALVLDPNYAVAHAHIAWCHEQRFFRGGFHPADKAAALKHAQLALSAGPDDPLALSIASFVHANITHEYELAFHALDRALQMNSNSALAFGFSALLNALAERYDKAVEHAQRALRLSPFDPLNYHPHLALALVYLFTKRFDHAVIHSNRAIQANPGFGLLHVILVASHAGLGDFNAARAAAEHLMELSPGFTVSNFLREDFARPQRMDVIANALRKSGLPL